MPLLDGIAAHVVVEQQRALHEYRDPSPQEPYTATSYIEILPNIPFTVYVRVPPAFTFLGDVLVFRIFLDNILRTHIWHSEVRCKEAEGNEEETRRGISGLFNSDDGSALQFPHVLEYGNANPPGDVEAWEGREILFQIFHGRLKLKDERATGSSTGPAGHGAVDIFPGPAAYAFVFKYRTRDMLKSILHRPPLPTMNVAAPDNASDPTAHPADNAFRASLRPNESSNLWCYCRKIKARERAVTCDNDLCAIKTFHWGCVRLREEPRTLWLCPECRELPEEEREVKGWNEYYRGSYLHQLCPGCTECDGRAFSVAVRRREEGGDC